MARQSLTRVILIVAVAAFFFSGGSFYFGYRTGQQDPKVITVKGITNLDDPEVKADFGVFWQVWEKLKEGHIDGNKIADKEMVYGAISGLAGSFGDPHTVFFPPADSKKFEEDVTGAFGGIGAEIGVRDDQLLIIAPLKESPAEQAGLRSKDKILQINGKATGGLNVNDAVKLIRGEIGTKVVLTILRNGWDAPKEFEIIRNEIRVPTVDWDIKEDDILHVKLYAFNENAPNQFYKAVVDGLTRGAKGMVLDLRNNPGGFLEVAVNLAGWFLPRNTVVVSEVFRDRPTVEFRANGNAALRNFPTVVLINEGSASASEILAGALRDVLGSKLVGEKSFGKGTVQELQKLTDDSSIKITIAKWLTPTGLEIEKNGLVPDVEIKLSEEDIKSGNDAQLTKALEVLKSKIAQAR